METENEPIIVEYYGYLAGTHARDKDAVVSSLLICEMAAQLKAEGKTLLDRMNELYTEYGYYRDALDSFTQKSKDGLERIASMMKELKAGDSPFENTVQKIDYSTPVDAEPGFGKLPVSDVLKYILADGSWIAVRPAQSRRSRFITASRMLIRILQKKNCNKFSSRLRLAWDCKGGIPNEYYFTVWRQRKAPVAIV